MNPLFALNKRCWYARLPIKWGVFGLTLLAVCFPYPHILLRHLRHWRDPNALIEPDAPAIEPLVEELGERLSGNPPPREALAVVERFVYEKIPYEWDWNTWGTADYLPTVTEVIEMGKEDCDGRAVLAASLLHRLGFEARLVTDFAHVWVKTDRGETMGPGKKKAVIATERGLRLQWDALTELPRGLTFGLAVFPLTRELIVLVVLWLLLLRCGGGRLPNLAGLALFVTGLLFLRSGGRDYLRPCTWMQWVGFGGWVAGLMVMLLWTKINARQAEHLEAMPTGGSGSHDAM